MRSLRILCIEDSAQDFFLLERSLKKNFELDVFKLIASEAELRAALAGETWDLVLSDFNIPKFSALQALNIVKETAEEVPFVLITGAIGEEAVVDFLKFGAQDVVLKSNLKRLNFVIERVFREVRIKQRAAEAQRAQEEAIVAREEMLAIVSHDLRNPLTAIQLNAQAIESKVIGEGSETVRSAASNARSIYRSSMRMKSLIADILDKVRLDAGTFLINKKIMPLNLFIKDVVEVFRPLADEKMILFEVEGVPDDPSLEIDFDRLFQILSNLIGNALKFTSAGGTIRLRFAITGGGLEVSVEDSGQGIAEDQLAKIFDKYWHNERAGRLGVGLGLSIVKDIVEAHGGNIKVSSKKNIGSTFSLWLPGGVIPVNARDKKRSKSKDAEKTVVLVEDDEDLCEVIEDYLVSFGYKVESFHSGEQALHYFSIMREPPKLAILDYRLSDMTGGDVSECLRSQYPYNEIPVIFLSAETHLEAIAKRYRASTFLTKPLGVRELKQVVEKFIDV